MRAAITDERIRALPDAGAVQRRDGLEEMQEDGNPEMRVIVVGIDRSPAAAEALKWAVAEASLTGARVEAIYAWDPSPIAIGASSPPRKWRPLREASERVAVEIVRSVIGMRKDVRIVPRMVIGRAAEILVEASVDADLLVVGSRGAGGLEGIELGSVSQHCAAYAECPVVIVHYDPLRPGHLPTRRMRTLSSAGARD